MSAYSASIYSVDEDGNTTINTTTTTAPLPVSAPAPSSSSSLPFTPSPFFPASSRRPPPIFGLNSGPSSARPHPSTPPAPLPSFAFPPGPPPTLAAPAPPPAAAPFLASPAPASLPTYIPSSMGSVFTASKAGSGMKDLSEVTVLGERVIAAMEKDSSSSNTIIGTIRQKMLHQTPEFVVVLKELAEKTDEVAKATRLTEHFKHLEIFRVEAALTNTLHVLMNMTSGLLTIVSSERKLSKHVRAKILDRLGKLHYGIEQIVRGLELVLNCKLTGYNGVLLKIKEIRTLLKAQNGKEE
ncbi:hypothetical protein DL95DRAFT_442700 [Leptodontidium sp. 2 PMI_412]|nr:hypothetical protein DL95DRAFT_442700 [Leptodontidium sp. 2 PMI_412]